MNNDDVFWIRNALMRISVRIELFGACQDFCLKFSKALVVFEDRRISRFDEEHECWFIVAHSSAVRHKVRTGSENVVFDVSVNGQSGAYGEGE